MCLFIWLLFGSLVRVWEWLFFCFWRGVVGFFGVESDMFCVVCLDLGGYEVFWWFGFGIFFVGRG